MVVMMRPSGGTSRNPRARVVAAGLLALILGGWLVLVARGAGGAEAAAVDPEIRATLGVFRDARTVADRLPGAPNEDLQAADDRQPGENPDLSRRVLHLEGKAYLWPMAEGVCHSSPAGSGCIPTRVVKDRGVSIGVQTVLNLRDGTYDEVRVFGIARDGIADVRLRLHNGQHRTASVRGNTFLVLDLPDRPAAVEWTDQTGAHSIEVPGQPAAELAAAITGS